MTRFPMAMNTSSHVHSNGASDHRLKPGIKTNLSISVDVLSYFITLAES